ncbi:PTS lactose transporter subunit IIB [Lactobacillus iners]|uniref:PTS lactose transporter subunit IIB n=1 Tax=Lactobacillus iners TaxID=147802 RepID=UPI0001E5E474|nr:PTS lactose transporter subunit IIB [Lactobacillus iners]EFO72563.1 PTS system, Lactose/Cellobiose specific IIB subunit [Lactobacillus iners SPIN 2503V10-D]EFU78383.1 PTS system, Lactose/Cellobiose specific IIB subunit [Lactobacillus iners ATCC 55195]MBW8450053.1 PTS lactose transporter subunit IIB [Lactobacillus iners]MCT7671634.1 PTS lactose transporter subunit IIB [Lactobacillus iners]MCT7682825.1 PTS lactose transporter subunit IIB [Lactobacillus iners]
MNKKVTIACTTGLSASILVTKIKQLITDDAITIESTAASQIADIIKLQKTDLLLLAPQLAYLRDQVNELILQKSNNKILVRYISIDLYSQLNANQTLEQIKKIL